MGLFFTKKPYFLPILKGSSFLSLILKFPRFLSFSPSALPRSTAQFSLFYTSPLIANTADIYRFFTTSRRKILTFIEMGENPNFYGEKHLFSEA